MGSVWVMLLMEDRQINDWEKGVRWKRGGREWLEGWEEMEPREKS